MAGMGGTAYNLHLHMLSTSLHEEHGGEEEPISMFG